MISAARLTDCHVTYTGHVMLLMGTDHIYLRHTLIAYFNYIDRVCLTSTDRLIA